MKKFLLGLLLLILVVRAALPVIIKKQVNAKLAALPAPYRGKIDDVDLFLLRGQAAVEGLEIWDKPEDTKVSLPRAVARIAWGPLFKGKLVAAVYLHKPAFSVKTRAEPKEAAKKAGQKAEKAKDEAKQEGQEKTGESSIPQMLQSVMPFELARFEARDGAFVFQDKDHPDQRFEVSDLLLIVEDLTNVGDERAKARAEAKVMDSGTAELKMTLLPTAEQPTFDLSFELKKLSMPSLNPFLRAQAGVDVDQGTFELFSEAHAKNGGFAGYVKPFLKDVEMGKRKGGGVKKKVKEAVAGTAVKALESDDTKAVATRIEFKGKFGNPKTDVWTAVIEVLRNAFVEALKPRFGKK